MGNARFYYFVWVNIQGRVCFSKKIFWFPMYVAEKNILILVEEKKNNLIQSFCHIT